MEQQGKLVNVSGYVIGRTPAYYEADDNWIYIPNLWTICHVTKINKFIDPRSEVYRLTKKGEEKYDDWADARAVGYDLRDGRAQTKVTPEEIWEDLTSNPDYSFKIR